MGWQAGRQAVAMPRKQGDWLGGREEEEVKRKGKRQPILTQVCNVRQQTSQLLAAGNASENQESPLAFF